jgi:hypothetical protein
MLAPPPHPATHLPSRPAVPHRDPSWPSVTTLVRAVAGGLKDRLAPHCAVVETRSGEHDIDPRCAQSEQDQRGLLMVIVASQLMALIAAGCWGLASALASKRRARHEPVLLM